MELTKTQQEKVLDSGLALGAIMLGVECVDGKKMNLELDFRTAWRKWPYAFYLPQVKADDVLHILRKSHKRLGTRVASWEGAWPFTPVAEDWSFDELATVIHEAIPALAWRDIVKEWLRITL
jgi:hypothetical protein